MSMFMSGTAEITLDVLPNAFPQSCCKKPGLRQAKLNQLTTLPLPTTVHILTVKTASEYMREEGVE